RPSLGTLNHNVLTVEALERRGVEVAGVVLNRYPDDPDTAERTNPRVIEEMTGVDVLGRIPSVPELDVDDANPSDFVDVFRRRVDVSRILDSLVD
ncbi:MAG: AAA family ATPase, partial [Halobacteria archaeon]|nr:AAA family ATPase [Halobacteria archaeon]